MRKTLLLLAALVIGADGHAEISGEQPRLSSVVRIARGDNPAVFAGSGVVMDAEGHVLAASEAVGSRGGWMAEANDGTKFPAALVAIDRVRGVALLKIAVAGGPSLAPAKTGAYLPGEAVWLDGLEARITGVASLREQGPYVVFDTRTPLGPEAFGTPLVNGRGEVIGINTLVYGKSDAARTLAVPAAEALALYREMRDTGGVSRATMELLIQDLSADLAATLGRPDSRGALVVDAPADGPACKAGIRPGDVILELDGASVEASGEIPAFMRRVKPGERVAVRVWRDGKVKEFVVITERMRDTGPQQKWRKALAGTCASAVYLGEEMTRECAGHVSVTLEERRISVGFGSGIRHVTLFGNREAKRVAEGYQVSIHSVHELNVLTGATRDVRAPGFCTFRGEIASPSYIYCSATASGKPIRLNFHADR